MSATATHPAPTTAEAIRILAGLTLKRVVRGKLVWFVSLAGLLPSLIGAAMRLGNSTPEHVARVTMGIVEFLFAILPPMLVGSAVGDELGSKTATYLWSRPLPRWTILVAKLVVLGPLVAALLVASWLAALAIGHGLISPQAIGALVVGSLVITSVVAGIATIGPKHGIAFSLLYVLLIDMAIGLIPASIHNFSVIHQTAVLAGLPRDVGEDALGSAAVAAIWLVAMAAVWLTVALRSLRHREV